MSNTNAQPSPTTRLPDPLCQHTPRCPSADRPDREAAYVVAAHPEQGWSLLCNSLLLWEDTGALLPDGQVIAPHRPTDTPGGLILRYPDHASLIVGTPGSGKSNLAALHAAMEARSTGAAWPV